MTIEKTIADAVAKELEPKLTELSKAISSLSNQQDEILALLKSGVVKPETPKETENPSTETPIPEEPKAEQPKEEPVETPVPAEPSKPDDGAVTFQINNFTYSKTWNKGVYREEFAVISTPATEEAVEKLVKGTPVKLADGDVRSVVWPQLVDDGKNISLRLSGGVLDADKVGYPNVITLASAADTAPPPTPSKPSDQKGKTDRRTSRPLCLVGMNEAGLEFGSNIPGTFKRDYFSPNEENFRGIAERGIKQVRLPVKWERVQRNLYGPLSANDIGYIQDCLEWCERYDIQVIIDLHNYMRRKVDGTNYLIGSPEVPSSALADCWRKLAEVFKGNQTVFGLNIMNEPYPLQPSWSGIAQETYRAIREIDKETFIIIDGAFWANAHGWPTKNEGIPWFGEEFYRIIWDAHCYLDSNASGLYKDRNEIVGTSAETIAKAEKELEGEELEEFWNEVWERHYNIGIKRVKDFLDWCVEYDQMGYIGEFG